jgi:hypothetical protein
MHNKWLCGFYSSLNVKFKNQECVGHAEYMEEVRNVEFLLFIVYLNKLQF